MRKKRLRNLWVFIDESAGVYAVVVVSERRVDSQSSRLAWVKHFRILGKEEKKGYIRAFPRGS